MEGGIEVMILFFDTETTGLPKNYKASMHELDNWPRVIQLAWAVFGDDARLICKACDLIKPNGWVIPEEKFWKDNGFSQDKSMAEGIHIHEALRPFLTYFDNCHTIVAHNIEFDYPIVGAEMLRLQIEVKSIHNKVCTMKSTTDIVQLPGRYGFKWPKLEELHRYLFRSNFEGAHDALNDVMATAKCYFELKNRQLLPV